MNKKMYTLISLIGMTVAYTTRAAPQNNDLGQKLLCAAEQGQELTIKQLIEREAGVHHQNQFGHTPLISAASKGHVSIVKLLIEQGAKIDHQDHGGDTALMSAASEGHVSIVRLLLEYGAKINHRDHNGDTALIAAAARGDVSTVKLLLEVGAEINHQDHDGCTALIAAVQERTFSSCKSHALVIRSLIEYGAEINHQEHRGPTPLIYAIGKGDTWLAKLLLERGAHGPQTIKPQYLLINPHKNAFLKRKFAIETFFNKLHLNYRVPHDVSCIIKKYADVPEEHGPRGTGCKLKTLKNQQIGTQNTWIYEQHYVYQWILRLCRVLRIEH